MVVDAVHYGFCACFEIAMVRSGAGAFKASCKDQGICTLSTKRGVPRSVILFGKRRKMLVRGSKKGHKMGHSWMVLDQHRWWIAHHNRQWLIKGGDPQAW